jgi:putative N6-adenine-specific DNA methylase
MSSSFFAVCAPGLEPFTLQELRSLGLQDSASPAGEAGGVEFNGSLADLYRANLQLRTASRVLVRAGAFYAAAFSELRKKAGRLPWETYLTPGQPVALRVTCHKSRLYHSDAVAERIAGAIADRLGRPAQHQRKKSDDDDGDPTAQLIVVRLDHDHCAISVDASGALLHRRGYRLATAKAPLRETLAAGLLMASGWEHGAPLLDPFCGSGAIPIEAALMALNIPPGRARRFAFMEWPNFDRKLWQRLIAVSPAAAHPIILASDRDAGAIEAARANAERAGVAEAIEFSRRAISAIEPPALPGWVVTNPPYGVRVSRNRDLRNLYAQFGHALRAKCPGWQVGVLSSDLNLLRQVGVKFEREWAFVNGGLKVRFARGQVSLRADNSTG